MNRKNVIAFTLAMIAVILNAVLGSFNIERMSEEEKKLQESLDLQSDYETLLALMTDAETGQRGYLLTGNEDYLKPYFDAEPNVGPLQDAIATKLGERPEQAVNLKTIRSLIQEKFDYMSLLRKIRRVKGLLEASAALSDNRGKAIMDQLREAIRVSLDLERKVLVKRTGDVESETRLARFSLLAGAALALSIVLAAAAMVNSELRRRQRANEALIMAKTQTEAALGRLDAFFANAPYGIAYLDDHLRFLRVNETFAEVNNLPVEKILGKPLPELNPSIPHDLLNDYRTVLAERKPLLNRTLVTPSKTWELVAFPVTVPNAPVSLGVIGVDVTARKEAERRARESEVSFQSLTESMPQIVWSSRRDGWIEYFNTQWFDYTGLTHGESFGDKWIAALHEEDRERCRALWTRSIATGEPYELEFRLRRRDGNYHWFLARGRAINDENGALLRWLGTFTDNDDNKRLVDTLDRTVQERTASLIEQRTFLDAILNNVSEGIVACDAHGKLLFNRATQEMHGLPAESLPQEEWPNHYSLFEADGVTPMLPKDVPLTRAMNGEILHDVEMIIHPRHGPERYLLCSGQPLIGANDQPFGEVVSMRDMTERRAYEKDLLEFTKLLKASNEELEKFAYVASHDLQEPLRKIQSFGDRLSRRNRDSLDEEGRDSLARILDAAARMRRLIEDLLAFSRIASNARPFESVGLNGVLAEVRGIFELRLEAENGTLEVGPLPAVMGDESQLRQLFQNLIGNAMKFANPRVPPHVSVTAMEWSRLPPEADPPAPPGNGWRICVTDNGIGFEQQYAERIFELFQRLHGRSAYEGTGLGLAIVKKIVVRHGATITARSHLGEGATFSIDWPVLTRSA